MTKNSVRVALNMSILSVLQKINKARAIVAAMAANPQVFANPSPALAVVTSAIDDAEAAQAAAADGGKSKTAAARSKLEAMMKLITDLSLYVQITAAGDEAVVALAGLDVKKSAVHHVPEFSVVQGPHSGSVTLRVKAHDKTVYKWQYCKDPMGSNAWTDIAYTDISKSGVSHLSPGLYWFRVVFIDSGGEHDSSPMSFAVN